MKWSKYDLDLREWCIRLDKPIPGKPEAYYEVKTHIGSDGKVKYQPAFNGIAFSGVRDYTSWGKNLQVDVRLNDYDTAEEYWEAVSNNAAKNLDANSIKHRSQWSEA